jgi:hypothetical protein
MAWVAIICVTVVPCIFYAAMMAICNKEIYSHTAAELQADNYCFNLTRFGMDAAVNCKILPEPLITCLTIGSSDARSTNFFFLIGFQFQSEKKQSKANVLICLVYNAL